MPVRRPSQTSAISSLIGDGERGAWVAAGGDVGVELVGAGDEPLRVIEVAERRPVADEQRAGLQQVAGGPGGSSARGAIRISPSSM